MTHSPTVQTRGPARSQTMPMPRGRNHWLVRSFSTSLWVLVCAGTTRTLQGCTGSHDNGAVVTSMREIAHLDTEEFHIQQVIEKSEPQTLLGHVVGEDHILLVVPGTVSAGVDMGALHDGDVEVDSAQHHVRLRLPAPVIFTTAIDTAHVRAFRRTDLLARAHEDLETNALHDAEVSLRRAANDAGILTKARTSAERILRSLLRSLGFTTVDITWAS